MNQQTFLQPAFSLQDKEAAAKAKKEAAKALNTTLPADAHHNLHCTGHATDVD
jgi:hypothetical protein